VSWTPSYPEWLAPSRSEVADLQWLAYQAYVEGSVRSGGMAAAVAWVQGGRAGPVTDRDERPVTRELAAICSEWVAEMWAAVAVADGGTPPPLQSTMWGAGISPRCGGL
jgi:hypothetical protein